MRFQSTFLFFALILRQSHAFDYGLVEEPEEPGIVLSDVATGIPNIKTIFINSITSVKAIGIEWEEAMDGEETPDVLEWKTTVDGTVQASGFFNLTEVGRELPLELEVGEIKVLSNGRHKIVVYLTLGETSFEASNEYESYAAGVSIIPLLLILVVAATTHMVELSLFAGIFVGACMVQGNINDGFKDLLSHYILNALADVDHGYVYLFTMFLSGLVGMVEKSGGMGGFTMDIMRYARSTRSAQFACFVIGIFIFFDDYANCLLAGETMRPLFDTLCLSREKLSFIVDATAAPIASISPISSWVGFEVQLIQEQIDRIIEIYGAANLTIEDSGLAVFLQTIKYRYYPIFMIVLMVVLILSERDFGPMLVAERKTRVYQQTDGGAGKGPSSLSGVGKHNQPSDGTPKKSWNLIVPILLLVFFIVFLIVKTGEDGTEQTLMDKIENSDSFSALLWGTMATAIVTLLMYLLQPVQSGEIVAPSFKTIKGCMFSSEADCPHCLMTVGQSVESFLYGMGRIFPALIVLTLAWASGSIMIAVGCDRLFSRWIVGGINPEALPTMSFLISFLMALATGTSWGTMSILFPLILVPTYEASNGDALIFYAVTAGVLSGSVAGDHGPYVVVIVIVSVILGTVPIGYSNWPNIIAILLGTLTIVAFVYGICVPVLSPSGRYDIMTELQLKFKGERGHDSELFQLREHTKLFMAGAVPSGEDNDTPETLKSEDAVGKELEDEVEALAEAEAQNDETVTEAQVDEPTQTLDC